ncbi:MAG: orotidine-5'-phosphate decarboxylase [Planctomycetota bacterium]|jgi:orotidine-5'-phosphate decarboxylase
MSNFSEALTQRLRQGAAPAVVGLDPRLLALPAGLQAGAPPAERITAFYQEVLPLLARHVPVVKPNIAFFERYGAAGFGAYEAVCRLAREHGLLVIGDIKRGDIGSTAQAYADGHCGLADAVTLNPYLGTDALEPFLEASRKQGTGLFVLVRTSNPSAAEFQRLATADGSSLARQVARAVHRWGEQTAPGAGYGLVGAVVGATHADEIAEFRALMPRAWLLLPGVGVQGGRVADVRAAFDDEGLGGLVSQSRGILQAFDPKDGSWRDQVESAAARFQADVLAVARP